MLLNISAIFCEAVCILDQETPEIIASHSPLNARKVRNIVFFVSFSPLFFFPFAPIIGAVYQPLYAFYGLDTNPSPDDAIPTHQEIDNSAVQYVQKLLALSE